MVKRQHVNEIAGLLREMLEGHGVSGWGVAGATHGPAGMDLDLQGWIILIMVILWSSGCLGWARASQSRFIHLMLCSCLL